MPEEAGGSPVVKVAVGEMGTAALLEDGSVWLWGMSRYFTPTRLPLALYEVSSPGYERDVLERSALPSMLRCGRAFICRPIAVDADAGAAS